MTRSPLRSLTALALLLLGGGAARADQIFWEYSWQRGAAAVAADGPDGTGGVSFTNQRPGRAADSSDIIATNLRVFSNAPAGTPDTMITGGAYTLTLTITDLASGESGSLTFAGKLTGTFSAGNSNLTNVFDSPTAHGLILGGNEYDVTIGPFAPPGPPNSRSAGSIGAHVEVTPLNSTLQAQDVPEPSALLLCGLGASLVSLASWRKMRKAPN